MVLPAVFQHAALADGLVSAAEAAGACSGALDGLRPGVLLAGLPGTDVTVQSQYARHVIAALDDRDVIGAFGGCGT